MAIPLSLIVFDSPKSLQSSQFRAEMHNLSLQGVLYLMQISRHWRLNPQRYRLQGVRYGNGEVSLQARPAPRNHKENQPEERLQTNESCVAATTR